MKRLSALFTLFARPLQLNARFFVFMFALGWLCTQTEVQLHLRGAKPYDLSAPELFVDLYLLCAILTLVPLKARRWLRPAVATVLYAAALVDMFCYVRFESTLTPTMLMLFFETNSQEAAEFLGTYVTADTLLSPVGAVLLIALAHAVSATVSRNALFAQKPQKSQEPQKSQKPQMPHWVMPLAGLAAVLLLAWSAVLCWPNKAAMLRLMAGRNIGEVEHELTRKAHATLYLPIYRLAFSLRANQLAAQQVSMLMGQVQQARVDSCDYRSPHIVLIIGESYNRHRSQLYGYSRPTTPRQLQLMLDGSLVAFTDVVAPWNLTSFVFKHAFSMNNVGDSRSWCEAPLFPMLFRRAGYRVVFLTNQFVPKKGEQVFDFSGGFFLNDPRLSQTMFDVRNQRTYTYDESLLACYDALQPQAPHQLTIFHLMGQHVDYLGRFPRRTRRHFTPDDYGRTDLSPERQLMNADYDNAVLYNDSVVDQIVRRFRDDDAIVVYMPDHGEECFNDTLGIFGRLHSAEIDRRLAREEFEIPFWIWASERYRTTHPDVWTAVRRYRHRPYMTDLLPHMLLSLAGIHTPLYRRDCDLLDSTYDEHRPRLLKATTDYNLLLPPPSRVPGGSPAGKQLPPQQRPTPPQTHRP